MSPLFPRAHCAVYPSACSTVFERGRSHANPRIAHVAGSKHHAFRRGKKHGNSLGEGSDHHLAIAPGIDRTSKSVDVALDIIVISTGRIDRDDLFDGGAGMAHKRDGDVPPDVARSDELVPMRKAIFPGRHLSIAALVLVDTRAILDATFVAKGKRLSGFSRGAELAFMEEEGQRII